MAAVDLAHRIESIVTRRAPSRFSASTQTLDKAFVLLQERCGLLGSAKHSDLEAFAEALSLHYGKGRNLKGLGLEGKLETFLAIEAETRPWVSVALRELLREEAPTIASLAAQKHRTVHTRARR